MNWSGSPPGPDHLQASLFTKQQVQTLDHLLLLSSSDVKSILSDLPLVVAVELKAILKAKVLPHMFIVSSLIPTQEEVRKAEDAVHQAEESLHFARNKLEQLLGGLSVSSTPSPLSKGRFASGALNSSRASLAASPSTVRTLPPSPSSLIGPARGG